MPDYIFQNVLNKAETLFFVLMALPALLLMRILRPFAIIRVGPLYTRRIGHFLDNTEIYLCDRAYGMHKSRTFDIFYHYMPASNTQAKLMWERTGKLNIVPFHRFMLVIDKLNRMLPDGGRHTILTPNMDFYGLRAKTKPYLSFTEGEERFGKNELDRLGISSNAPFVCFHARDSAYLKTVYPEYKWQYQDFRDSSIENYIPAAEELAGLGYYMVRMGAVVSGPIKTKNPRIIDYAVNGRTDFMDMYLGAKCRFFICDGSGISSIPMAFRRPIVWVNFVQLEFIPIWGPQDLFIVRKLWLRKEKRFLTFREIINSDIRIFSDIEQYAKLGIELVENTPEEIKTIALEMDERLKGNHKTTAEEEGLQSRFWSIYRKRWPERKILSRIGSGFLRQNPDFLN